MGGCPCRARISVASSVSAQVPLESGLTWLGMNNYDVASSVSAQVPLEPGERILIGYGSPLLHPLFQRKCLLNIMINGSVKSSVDEIGCQNSVEVWR